jgi:serine/threonine-protein kinase RsbW
MATDQVTQRWSLAADLDAPVAARRALEDLGAGLDDHVRERTQLVVTEVVANSVLHAGLAASQPIDIHVSLLPGLLRIEITDDGPGFSPPPALPKPCPTPGGWGLWLVDQLSDRWGTDRTHSTRVWCEFDTNRQPSPRRAGPDRSLRATS